MMQKPRTILLGLACIALLVVIYFALLRPLYSDESAATSTTASSKSDTTGGAITGAATEAGAQLPKLDCKQPVGDVARVDGTGIPARQLCDWLAKTGGANARTALDQMIDALVVKNALAAKGATVSEQEIDAALRELAVDPKDQLYRQQVRERLELRKLATLHASLEVSEREVDAELAAGAPGIDRGQGVRVEGWIARVAPGADGKLRDAAKEAAHAFSKALATQQPADAAKAHGLAPLAPFVVGPSGLEPALENAASSVRKGELSAPVETKTGWVVIRVLERVEGEKLDDKTLRERVRRALENRKAAAATKDVLTRLRNAARVEILVEP